MTAMMKGGPLPEPVGALAQRIEAWRNTRPHKASPMPEELWSEAAALATRHGVNRISSALGIKYEALKLRTLAGGSPPPRSGAAAKPSFVEVVGIGNNERTEAETELEVVSIGGARLRLRQSGCRIDLPGVIEAFCRSVR